MPDCFISYASVDEELARFVEWHLQAQNVTSFMASLSIPPGEIWTDAVWTNLRASSWIIFLASRAACRSPYVLQELGGALAAEKRIVPIVWDMNPSELPGWINQRQAIDLRGRTWEDLAIQVQYVANAIHSDRQQGALVAGAVLMGLLWLGSKGKK